MNKYLENLKEEELIGKKINTKDGDYTILLSKKNGEFLDMLLVDVEDAQKDKEHKKQFNALKDMLKSEDYSIRWYYNDSSIWRLRYAEVRIANPILGCGNSRGRLTIDCRNNDFYVYFNTDRQLALDDYSFPLRKEDDEILELAHVKEELYNKKGLIGGLRKMFSQLFGAEYDKDLKNRYFDLAKKNNEDMIASSQEQIDFFTRKIQSNKENINELEKADESYTEIEI